VKVYDKLAIMQFIYGVLSRYTIEYTIERLGTSHTGAMSCKSRLLPKQGKVQFCLRCAS